MNHALEDAIRVRATSPYNMEELTVEQVQCAIFDRAVLWHAYERRLYSRRLLGALKENSLKITFSMALGLAFIILKLTRIIDWSWWWITFPLWAAPAIGALLLIAGIIVLAFESKRSREQRKLHQSLSALSTIMSKRD